MASVKEVFYDTGKHLIFYLVQQVLIHGTFGSVKLTQVNNVIFSIRKEATLQEKINDL